MKYNRLLHRGLSLRLKGYDYTSPGGYFVTLCVKNRAGVLGEIQEGKVILSRIGEIVKESWEGIPRHFPNARLDEYVIMPDHFHGIVILRQYSRDRDEFVIKSRDQYVVTRHAVSRQEGALQHFEQFGHPIPGSLSTIVRSFKSAASKQIHTEGHEESAWQSRFYEHIIRTMYELNRIREYIRQNPSRWTAGP